MSEKINFYAPIQDERTGKMLYGAAAMNYRVYQAGGLNQFAFNLVQTGMQIGFEQSKLLAKSSHRK